MRDLSGFKPIGWIGPGPDGPVFHPIEHECDYRPSIPADGKAGPLLEECRYCGQYRPLPVPRYFKDMKQVEPED